MMKNVLVPSALVAVCGLLGISHSATADTSVTPNTAVTSAQQALAQNQPDQAISTLTAYTSSPVSDPLPYRLLAEAYLASHMAGKAAKPAETAIKLAGDSQEKAKCDLVAGEAYLEQAAEKKDSDSGPVSDHGGLISSSSTRAKDARVSDGAVVGDPKYNNGANIDQIGSGVGGDDPTAGNLGKAEKYFSDANKLSPDIGNVHDQLGVAYLLDGRPQDAKGEFQAQIAKAGPIAESYYWLGQIDAANGDTDGAVKSYKSVVELTPTDPNVYTALAKTYLKSKKPAEAAWAQGMADVYSGDQTGAQASFDKAGDTTPGVLEGRAALAEAGQQTDAATGFLSSALAANPNDAVALRMQGDLLSQTGDNAGAVKAYQGAVTADPQMDQAYVGLGKAYDQLHQPESAIAAYESAIKVNPNNQDALLAAATDNANIQHLADAATNLQTYLERYPIETNESQVQSQLSLIKSQPSS